MKIKLLTFLLIAVVIGLLHRSCASFWEHYNATHPNGNNKYYEMITQLSPKEAEYMKLGQYTPKSYEASASGSLGKFTVWYPSDMETSKTQYPIIISNNGTGTPASKYQEWFRRMASWGFIVVGNEEPTSWNGNSAQASLDWILKQNTSPSSIFYRHLDTANIGTVGHSQGGTGVENAITVQPSAKMYKAAVMLASTYNGKNNFLRWEADASKIKAPIMILVADTDGLTPLKDYNSLWKALPNNIIKVAGRRLYCGHGEMLVYVDGYVTAWFFWHLKGDTKARTAIMELKSNKTYKEVRINGL